MNKINLLIIMLIYLWANQVFAQDILTLEESIQLALKNNYSIKNSKLEYKTAQQTKKSAFTNYFPSISATGIKFDAEEPLFQIQTDMGFLEKGTVGYINAVQPIFAGGRIINGNKLASLGVEASDFKDRLTKDEIILKTKENYWQIISLEEKSRTIEKFEEMLNRLLEQVEDAYNSGIVLKNDVLKVKLRRNEILLNKSKLNNGTTIAKMAFCQHLGIGFDSTIRYENELTVDKYPQTLWVENSQVLKIRNEYKLLELSVRAEKLRTRIKRGEYLPEAGIGVSYQYLKFDESEDRSFGMIYGTISIPISGWWGGSHELRIRKLNEKIAENNLKDKSELLLLQMEKSWQDLTDAYTQYLLSEDSKEQARENMKVNEDSYKHGLITVSDLLEAQALLQQSEDQSTDAKTNYLLKKAQYLQVTGR